MSFVSSGRDILERCMREKGCPELDREVLLAGLPPTFKEWRKASQITFREDCPATPAAEEAAERLQDNLIGDAP